MTLYAPPEFWALKRRAFEFMSGGIAVVCGVDVEEGESVLGDRSCMGMVGGVVYVRGPLGRIRERRKSAGVGSGGY